jgi:hypothetical protein
MLVFLRVTRSYMTQPIREPLNKNLLSLVKKKMKMKTRRDEMGKGKGKRKRKRKKKRERR